MMIDTDVIIWYLKGNKNAYSAIEENKGFKISAISYIELVQGMRNKMELNELRKALKSWQTEILYVSDEISSKAVFYIERHYLSHSLRLADALIASTAISFGLPIVTGNDKHYTVLTELEVMKFRP